MSEGKHPINVYLGSGSKIKISALQNAINTMELHAAVVPISQAQSYINEQPVGLEETLRGATCRALSAYQLDPRGDIYIAIENGIHLVNGKWQDFAVVLADIRSLGYMKWVQSESVIFPTEAVLKTKEKEGGFTKNTVGKTMKEMGLVRFHDDPHLDLGQKVSRRDILSRAVIQLFNSMKNQVDINQFMYD